MNKNSFPDTIVRYARARVFFLAVLFAGGLVVAVCDAAQEPPLPEKPDLNVTYISQRPLHPGYWLEYPDDIPVE